MQNCKTFDLSGNKLTETICDRKLETWLPVSRLKDNRVTESTKANSQSFFNCAGVMSGCIVFRDASRKDGWLQGLKYMGVARVEKDIVD